VILLFVGFPIMHSNINVAKAKTWHLLIALLFPQRFDAKGLFKTARRDFTVLRAQDGEALRGATGSINASAGSSTSHPDSVHDGDDHKHRAEAAPGHGETWHYDDQHAWADKFSECEHQMQSPIDISTGNAITNASTQEKSLSGRLDYHALPQRQIKNNGHNVQVDGDFGTFNLPSGIHNALQFHFHFPSEHTLNGVHADGEVHIVHRMVDSSGHQDLAVVAILLHELKKIPPNRQSESGLELGLLRQLGFGTKLPQPGQSINISGEVDPNVFSAEFEGGYYHYKGSLTTPPCSETVHWYILQRPAAVTSEMVSLFKSIFPAPANNRRVQSLNGREVIYSSPSLPGEFGSHSCAAFMGVHVASIILATIAASTA